VSGSGVLKLTSNGFNQNGSFLIEDFNAARSVDQFHARFHVRLGDSTCCEIPVAPPIPALSAIVLGPQSALVQWPAGPLVWSLEQSIQVTGPDAAWVPVTQPIFESGGYLNVILPIDMSQSFLRLRRVSP
jgi:hypothetical protein